MTKVNVTYKGNEYTLKATGHATGSPEVCAAISALYYALEGFAGDDDSVKDFSVKEEKGDILIKIKGNKEAKAAFKAIAIGLELIAYSYPDYCNYKEKIITG